MNGIILYISDERDFDRDRVIQILLSIDGIYDDNVEGAKRDSSIDMIEGEYDYRGDSTIFMFKTDTGDISFRGSGPAAIDLAFRIQQRYPEPIHVIDQAYNFDLVISDFDSADDLSDVMDKA